MRAICRVSLWVLLIIVATVAPAQENVSVRGEALGGSSCALTEAWATINNPGALAYSEQQAAFLVTNRYLVQELNSVAAAASLKIRKHRVGMAFRYDGYALFNNRSSFFTYSMLLTPKLGAGIQTSIESINIAEGFGRTLSVNSSAGIFYKITAASSISAAVVNPVSFSLTRKTSRSGTSIKIAGAHNFSKNLFTVIQVEKELFYPAVFRAGVEYMPIEGFLVRGGVNSSGLSGGVGCRLGKWTFDLTASTHRWLGISPTIGVTFGK